MISRTEVAGIMAGGRGSRLTSGTEGKSLYRVGGKLLIDHVLDQVEAAGIEHIIVDALPSQLELRSHITKRWGSDAGFTNADPEGGTGGSVRRLVKRIGAVPALISTVDTVAPKNAFRRLVESAEIAPLDCRGIVIVSHHIDDEAPIWVQLDQTGRFVTGFGKDIAPSELCFGNVRWLSGEISEVIDRIPPERARSDAFFMSQLVHLHPSSVFVQVEDPVFDIDDRKDVLAAEEWLRGAHDE